MAKDMEKKPEDKKDEITFTKEELKQLYITGLVLIVIFSVFELIMASINRGSISFQSMKPVLIQFPFRAVMAMSLLIFFRSLKVFLKK